MPEQMIVTISGTATEEGHVMVTDQFGSEFEVNTATRDPMSGEPAAGERWALTKVLGRWVLHSSLAVPATPVIVGDRLGLAPVFGQVLDALDFHGIVDDQTLRTDDEQEVVLDDESDPAIEEIPEDYLDEHEDEGGTPDRDEEAGDKEENQPHPHNDRWSYVTICSYNQYAGLGPRRVRIDMHKLDGTRTDILCLQEANPLARTPIYSDMDGWNLYRPTWDGEGDPGPIGPNTNAILWREGPFEVLDKGYRRLVEHGDGRPGRFATWIRFRHKKSGQIFTVINTHLDTKAARQGHWDPGYPVHVAHYKESLDALVDMVLNHGRRGPVFLSGDFNYHWEQVVRQEMHAGLPRARFRAIQMVANWQTMGMGDTETRKGSGWIDYIWLRATTPGMVRPVWQKVLRGYFSDHRPVLVTYRLRNRGKRRD